MPDEHVIKLLIIGLGVCAALVGLALLVAAPLIGVPFCVLAAVEVGLLLVLSHPK
jgi:hypothetical protein